MRIMGIDPGITRCGIGVIDVDSTRRPSLVSVGVARSGTQLATHFRLRDIMQAIDEAIAEHRPDVVAIERVFAQDNLQSVSTTMQVMGVAMARVGQAGLPMAVHTPSEVKASVTGSGTADKAQVQHMVARILGLKSVPRPADAADSLAIAICHAWRGTGLLGERADGNVNVTISGGITRNRGLTTAQEKWAQAEAKARRTGATATSRNSYPSRKSNS